MPNSILITFHLSTFQTGAERRSDHFLCTFCGEHFIDSIRCDRHIDGHLTHQNCACCDKPVILIGSRLFELHVPKKVYQRTNQTAIATKLVTTDERDFYTDTIVSIDENSLLFIEKCDRDVAIIKPRKSYKRRSKHNFEYVKAECAIDIVDSIDADDLIASNEESPVPFVAQIEHSSGHEEPSQIVEMEAICASRCR